MSAPYGAYMVIKWRDIGIFLAGTVHAIKTDATLSKGQKSGMIQLAHYAYEHPGQGNDNTAQGMGEINGSAELVCSGMAN
jgi:hypothetical protein